MTEKIRVAIVGCGTIARRAHVPAWLDDPRATIAALCDPVVEAADQIKDRHRLACATHRDLGALLAADRPDVVDICAATPHHFGLARQALEAGCHVLLEKPPAPSLEQVQALAELSREAGRKLGVCFNYRYRDLVMGLKQAQDDGLLGEVVKVHVTHHGPLVFGDAEWLWDERRSKYLLWEFGIHFIDILVHLLGPHAEVVHVVPTVHPGVGHVTDLEVLVRFESGAMGRLEIVADSTRHSSFFTQINAYGTGMDAFVRWFPASMRLVAGQVNPLGLLAGEFRAIWDIGWSILTKRFLRSRNISHYRLIKHYLDWLDGGADFPLSVDRVLPTIRLLQDIEDRIPNYRGSRPAELIAGGVSSPGPLPGGGS